MGEAVANISKLALLNVLLNRIEELVLGDLSRGQAISMNVCKRHRCGVSRGFEAGNQLTSSLALVQRGISTIMLRTVCSGLANRGMSWKGETGTPSFSM